MSLITVIGFLVVAINALELPKLDSFLNVAEFGNPSDHIYLDDNQITVTKLWFDVFELDQSTPKLPLPNPPPKNWTRVDKMQVFAFDKQGNRKEFEFFNVGAVLESRENQAGAVRIFRD
jgi:hypothetical protein